MKKTKTTPPPSPALHTPISTLSTADIVISINGRDAGKRFIVQSTENGYALIVNGKNRRIETPKRKKDKHLKFEDKADGQIAEKLTEGGKITNNEVRRFLAKYAANAANTASSANTTEQDN